MKDQASINLSESLIDTCFFVAVGLGTGRM